MALDFGEKFIGVAIYSVNKDPYPTPYGRIQNKGLEYSLKEIKQIISNELIDELIIGLPHLIDGKRTQSTERAQNFINFIKSNLSLPIHEQDETLSTFEAESRMKNSPRYNFQVNYLEIDAVAASVILEDFIRNIKQKSHL
jgi:putative Holliday junction resolvase